MRNHQELTRYYYQFLTRAVFSPAVLRKLRVTDVAMAELCSFRKNTLGGSVIVVCCLRHGVSTVQITLLEQSLSEPHRSAFEQARVLACL